MLQLIDTWQRQATANLSVRRSWAKRFRYNTISVAIGLSFPFGRVLIGFRGPHKSSGEGDAGRRISRKCHTEAEGRREERMEGSKGRTPPVRYTGEYESNGRSKLYEAKVR